MEGRAEDPQAKEKIRELKRMLGDEGKSQEDIHQALLQMGITEEEIRSWEEEEDYGNLQH